MGQNHGLTLQEKCKFFDCFFNPYFYSLKMLVFYLERYETRFLAYFVEKEEIEKFHNFGRNNGLTPLENCQFSDFF